MRKMALAGGILLCIIIASFYENAKVESLCEYYLREVDKIEKSTEKGDFADAKEAVGRLRVRWDKDEEFLDAVTTHEDTDSVNVLFTELFSNMKQENISGALIVEDKLKLQFEHIEKRSEIKISNIF